MKLASHIKPKDRDTRPVDFHGACYVFKKGNDGEFTAEVPEKDAKKLIKTGHFSPYGAKLSRGGSATPPPPPPEDDPIDVDSFDPEVKVEAAELIAGTAEEIKEALRSVSSIEVVACAHALEQQTESPRVGVSKQLQDVLDMAKAAGGQG